jgi:hypothetical protein
MGLLEDFGGFLKTPEGQGLLAAGAGYLAGAQRGTPINNLGRGGLAGMLGYSNAMNQQREADNDAVNRQFRQMQLDVTKREYEKQKWLEDTAAQYYRPGQSSASNALAIGAQNGSIGPTVENAQRIESTPATRGGFDQAGYMQAIMQRYPMVGIDMAAKLKAANQVKLGANERVFDASNGKVLFDNVVPELKEGYLVRGPDGNWTADQNLYSLHLGAKRAGATNIAPKIELKTGESIAGQIGPMLKETRAQAMAGIKLVDSANRILDAAEQGNIYAGPGANMMLRGAQVADVLGLGGKTTQEKISNTRNVVRGMSEQAVAARSQLGGQAQISNSEQELLNKATAGDISELTAGEIIQIAKLNDRLGRQLYDLHSGQIQNISGDPNLAGLAKFYSVPDLPKQRQRKGAESSPAKPAQQGGVKFLGFE